VPRGTSDRHRRSRSAASRPPTASPCRSTAASPYALLIGFALLTWRVAIHQMRKRLID
jgi:hypothetical protein